ncbi:MAG: AI-2E family transporter, partial [Phycisphaeraceae bacterium]
MNHRGDQSTAQLLMLVSAVVVVAALYLGQAVLMPLALAVLLSFLLTPVAARLERLGLWRVPSVLAVTVLAFTVLGGVGWLVADQLADLIQSLPLYRTNIRNRIEALWGYGEGYLEWVLNFVEQFQEDFAPRPDPFEAPDPEPTADPVPVTIVQPAPSPLEIARFAGPLLGPLATAAMTIVFTLFILVQRDQLRDRIIRLAGLGRIDVTTKALDDAGRRISRYLLAQVLINVSYGVPIGIGLWIIGLPNALLWGVLAMLVRFVPFLGPWLGSLLPIAMSLAVFDDWTRPAAVISMFVVLELFSNNVMEPWLYGSSTGISMLAVVFAVVFWTWLWGAIGLVLATPLTVCLMVLGKYIDRLAFLNILLSDEPVLDPRSRFYQRLLAQHHEDALELADSFFIECPLVEVYDQILIPALHMAERDRHRGRLDKAQQAFAYSTV